MRALLILAALSMAATPPPASPPLIVHVAGDHALPNDRPPSCGASRRLLDDTYLVHLWPDRATINGTPWAITFAWNAGAILEHAAEPDAVTRETMLVEWTEPGRTARAELTLFGITEGRVACTDRVRLVGLRLH